MKHLFMLILLISWSYRVSTQPLSFSTIGQIYNYSVGDTFEYQVSTSRPSGGTSCRSAGYLLNTIIAYNVSGNSITYRIAMIQTDTIHQPGCEASFSDTNTYTIYNIDSYFDQVFRCDTNFTYNPYDSCYDSIFQNSNYNFHKQNHYHNPSFNYFDETYADSIGLVSMDDIAEAGEQETRQQLIYFHKASGEIWGQSQAITTTVAVIQPEIWTAKIIPTPAAESFKLILSKLPTGNLDFILSDGKGAHVFSKNITNLQTDMSRNKLSSGFYFWEIISENQVIVRGKLLLN